MKNFSSLLLIILVLFAFTLKISAAKAAGATKSYLTQQKNPGAKTAQTPQEKRQQFEQDAAAAIPDVEAEYAKVVSWVNSDQIPDDANRNTSLKNIAKIRKFLPVFNKQPKGLLYYPLSAWVYYYDNKPDKAMKQAVAGEKLAPHNSGVAKTCLALSLIYKDYATTAEVFANRNAASQETESQSPPAQAVSSNPQSTDTELNLDVNNIRPDLLGKVFDIRPGSVKQAGKNLLCVLLWKIDSNELDSNAPSVAEEAATSTEVEVKEPNVPAKIPPKKLKVSPSSAANSSVDGLADTAQTTPPPVPKTKQKNKPQPQAQPSEITPLEAFSKLQNRFAKDSKTVFMGINLNDPTKIENVKNWLGKNPQQWQTSMPSVDLQKKITSLFAAVPNKPTLLISGPDSTIRYVGDVNGFLPQMIIRNILNNPKEFEEPNEPNQPSAASRSPVVVELVKISPLPTESNKPRRPSAVKDVNVSHKQSQVTTPHPAAANSVAKQQQNDDFSANDYQAEKLLSNARAFLKIGNRLPSHMYRDPVEWCRQVMKNYPNTKYAQEAQMLLRNVPKEHRAQYNITDEELGL